MDNSNTRLEIVNKLDDKFNELVKICKKYVTDETKFKEVVRKHICEKLSEDHYPRLDLVFGKTTKSNNGFIVKIIVGDIFSEENSANITNHLQISLGLFGENDEISFDGCSYPESKDSILGVDPEFNLDDTDFNKFASVLDAALDEFIDSEEIIKNIFIEWNKDILENTN